MNFRKLNTTLAVLVSVVAIMWLSARDTPAQNDMISMPGMAPVRKSGEPGGKQTTPAPLNRAGELLARPILEEHLNGLPSPVEDNKIHSFVLAEILEYRANSAGSDTFRWDVFGWIGGDFNRLWIKTEGSQQLSSRDRGEGDIQLLYGRLIAPFWDFQAGARVQQTLGGGSGDARAYAVIGVQGIAPYLFDVEPAVFISDRGDVSARATVLVDLWLTQRLVLQPRLEANVAIQSDEKFGVGEGVNDTDIGLRLRYEIRREIAPYIGLSWLRRYGQTATIAEREGGAASVASFVAGMQLWF